MKCTGETSEIYTAIGEEYDESSASREYQQESSVSGSCEGDAVMLSVYYVGRGGLVVGRPTAVREDPGSNLTAAGRVYHDSHCDIQPKQLCTLTAVPRSTQPSTLRGTVK